MRPLPFPRGRLGWGEVSLGTAASRYHFECDCEVDFENAQCDQLLT